MNSAVQGNSIKTIGPNLTYLLSTLFVLLWLSGCSGSSSSRDAASSSPDAGPDVSPDTGSSPPASVSLSASSTLIPSGADVTLNWSSSNATSCTASGGWSGTVGLSGSRLVGPLNQDTTFTLSCTGTGGGGVQQLIVNIDPGNGTTVDLNAAPAQVAAGGSATLNWTSTGASSCSASGGWSGNQAVNGTFAVGPINANTTYQLTCDGPTGTAVAMVSVEVVDKMLRWQAPTQNVDGSPLTDLAGYVIYWGTSSRDYIGSHTINSPTTTEWQASMAPGSYYFAMTAYDAENNESGYSNEVLKAIP